MKTIIDFVARWYACGEIYIKREQKTTPIDHTKAARENSAHSASEVAFLVFQGSSPVLMKLMCSTHVFLCYVFSPGTIIVAFRTANSLRSAKARRCGLGRAAQGGPA